MKNDGHRADFREIHAYSTFFKMNSYTEFHEHLTNGLVADTRPQTNMVSSKVIAYKAKALHFGYEMYLFHTILSLNEYCFSIQHPAINLSNGSLLCSL